MEYVHGDLFESKDSLVHCVSKDLAMGRGIAVGFKQRFGYGDLKKQNLNVGDVGVLLDGNRSIFYLITKEKYYEKPKYAALQQCLVKLKQLCVSKNINVISMPKIGCGLDKLEWSKVEKIIIKCLDSIKVNVYVI